MNLATTSNTPLAEVHFRNFSHFKCYQNESSVLSDF